LWRGYMGCWWMLGIAEVEGKVDGGALLGKPAVAPDIGLR
jgi:hypothetical protein